MRHLRYRYVRYVATCDENPAFHRCADSQVAENTITRARTQPLLSATRATMYVAKLLITDGETGL